MSGSERGYTVSFLAVTERTTVEIKPVARLSRAKSGPDSITPERLAKVEVAKNDLETVICEIIGTAYGYHAIPHN